MKLYYYYYICNQFDIAPQRLQKIKCGRKIILIKDINYSLTNISRINLRKSLTEKIEKLDCTFNAICIH